MKCMICGKTDKKLFSFPSTGSAAGIERVRKWKAFVGASPECYLLKTVNYLCEIHFVDRDFQTPRRLKLTRYSVPSLHPPTRLTSTGLQFNNFSAQRVSSEVFFPVEIKTEEPDPLVGDDDCIIQNMPPLSSPSTATSEIGFHNVVIKSEEDLPFSDPNDDPDCQIFEDQSLLARPSASTSGIGQRNEDFNQAQQIIINDQVLDSSIIVDSDRAHCNRQPDNDGGGKKTSLHTFDGFSKKHNVIQVLGTQDFQDPSVIKSVLEKVKLRKQGSVYVVPLKKSKGRSKPLTKNLLERVIQKLPTVDMHLKNKLLSLIRGRLGKLRRKKNISKLIRQDNKSNTNGVVKGSKGKNKGKNKVNEKQKNLKQCTCSLHCNKYIRKKPIIKVCPIAYTKIDGQSLKGDIQQSFSDDSVFNVENIFTVSTILTNINDKSQIEQLCQLLIESLFRLKNVNTDGIMSKLVVYFSQGNGDSYSAMTKPKSETEEFRIAAGGSTGCNNKAVIGKSNQCSSYEHPRSLTVVEGTDKSCQLGSTQERVSDKSFTCSSPEKNNLASNKSLQEEAVRRESNRQHVRIHLNVFHDHSYLSQDSHILFDKPPYLVQLVNINTFRSSSKKTRIYKSPPKKSPKEIQREITKLHRYIARLKGSLKKKNEYIQKQKVKIRYLGSTLCQEKGIKRVRYPKPYRDFELDLYGKSENNEILSGNNQLKAIENISTSEVGSNVNERKRKKIIQTSDIVPSPHSQINLPRATCQKV